ncbi:NAD(P)-binding domain-containing protein [Gymnodinialimonas sp. 2305UL16-5]|uniref:NADPH-dependent F420 reductase n=1 Tax=Gymnodinialimonas mytili TaxID=3126503 RepID=UPI0030A86491
MKIAILGSGNMGRALGTRWANLSHEVIFAARKSEKAEVAAAEAGKNARAASLNNAASEADILFWSPRERNPLNVLSDLSVLEGKIIIDLANRSMDEVRSGAELPVPLAVMLAEQMPGAKVVKAFNTLAMEAFDIDADALRAADAELPIAGDDKEAKTVLSTLIEPLGFRVRDLGGLDSSRTLELLADAVRLGMMGGLGWRVHLAFRELPENDLGLLGERGETSYG